MPKGYWAWHLGVGRWDLDSSAIGIELCSYGWLKKVGDQYYNAYDGEVSANKVYDFGTKPFKWNRYYEKYTDAQLQSLVKLLGYLMGFYDIPLDKESFKNQSAFQLNKKAFQAQTKGVFTHNTFLLGKSDICPQDNILAAIDSV